MMKGPRRRSWAEMDHDSELLCEQVVGRGLRRMDYVAMPDERGELMLLQQPRHRSRKRIIIIHDEHSGLRHKRVQGRCPGSVN